MLGRFLQKQALARASTARLAPLRSSARPLVGSHLHQSYQSFRLLSSNSTNQNNSSDDSKQESKQEQQEEKKRKNPWEKYNEWLETNPLLTKAATSAVIVAAGDVLAQVAFDEATLQSFNWRRLAVMTTMGGCVIGPTLHFWYGALGSMFPAATTQHAMYRLCADQFVFAPAFICVIFGVQFTLEGRVAELKPHLEATWWEATKTNWQLWLPAQFITFRFIPGKFQVLFVNGVAVVWNMYISWVGHQDGPIDSSSERA